MQDELLRRAVHHHGGRNWKQVGAPRAHLLNFQACFLYWAIVWHWVATCAAHCNSFLTVQKNSWTCMLFAAEYFEDRTDVQCLHRWQKVLNPELVKGPWTKEVRQLGGSDIVCTFMRHNLKVLHI